jgi:archaetidylinositol phosphate synthase
MAPETPWDQRLARWLVRPLAGTPLRPNHITTLSLALGLAAGLLFARGAASAAGWGAALFMLARFVDHADGELARLTGRTSRTGYYYDYVAGALSSVALFTGIGVGYADGPLGRWAVALGLAASGAALAGLGFGLAADARRGSDEGPYPQWGPFELEDGIYLIGPITWLGGLAGFFVLGALGQVIFSAMRLGQLRRARPRTSPPPLESPSGREHT